MLRPVTETPEKTMNGKQVNVEVLSWISNLIFLESGGEWMHNVVVPHNPTLIAPRLIVYAY